MALLKPDQSRMLELAKEKKVVLAVVTRDVIQSELTKENSKHCWGYVGENPNIKLFKKSEIVHVFRNGKTEEPSIIVLQKDRKVNAITAEFAKTFLQTVKSPSGKLFATSAGGDLLDRYNWEVSR